MKKLFWGATIAIIVISIAVFLIPAWKPQTQVADTTAKPVAIGSPGEATYMVEDKVVTMIGGSSTQMDAGSQINTNIFGTPVVGDLNGDGTPDAAVFLQQYPGGTGTFYYVAAAINTGSGYQGTNALYLGDRIAPQTLEIRNNLLVANYADRGPTEPFSAKPSIGKSLYAQFVGNKLVDVTATHAGK